MDVVRKENGKRKILKLFILEHMPEIYAKEENENKKLVAPRHATKKYCIFNV